MSKRLALVEKFDLVLEQPGPMSTSAKAYAAGVRSLFSNSGLITPDLLIQLDPISRMPVKLVKFIDTNENTFLMPSDRVGDVTDDVTAERWGVLEYENPSFSYSRENPSKCPVRLVDARVPRGTQ